MKGFAWRSAAVVTLGAAVGRLLGIAREGVFASYFGVSHTTDAYMVAVLVPTLVQNLLAGGTLQAAFVPLLAEEESNAGRAAAGKLVADVFKVTIAVLVPVALVVSALAYPIARLAGPGLGADGVATAAFLLRALAWLIVLNGALTVMLGALNTYGRYASTALLSPVLNGVTIALIVALGPRIGIQAAVAGLLIGTFAQCVLQLAPLRAVGVRLRGGRFSMRLVHRFLPAFGPALLASGVAQGNPLADKVIGSFLAVGSVTCLGYAEMFAGGVAIVTTSVALVAFPSLSLALARRDDGEARALVTEAVQLNLLAAIPLAAVLGAFAPFVVRSVYGWGGLPPEELDRIAACLAAYALGIPFAALFLLLIRVYYALRRARAALLLSSGMFVLHVALALAAVPRLGAPGIALATSVSAVAAGLGGWFLLREDFLREAGVACIRLTARLALAAVLSAAPAALLLSSWSSTAELPMAQVLWRGALAGGSACALFLLALPVVSPPTHALVVRAWGRLRLRLDWASTAS